MLALYRYKRFSGLRVKQVNKHDLVKNPKIWFTIHRCYMKLSRTLYFLYIPVKIIPIKNLVAQNQIYYLFSNVGYKCIQ